MSDGTNIKVAAATLQEAKEAAFAAGSSAGIEALRRIERWDVEGAGSETGDGVRGGMHN